MWRLQHAGALQYGSTELAAAAAAAAPAAPLGQPLRSQRTRSWSFDLVRGHSWSPCTCSSLLWVPSAEPQAACAAGVLRGHTPSRQRTSWLPCSCAPLLWRTAQDRASNGTAPGTDARQAAHLQGQKVAEGNDGPWAAGALLRQHSKALLVELVYVPGDGLILHAVGPPAGAEVCHDLQPSRA